MPDFLERDLATIALCWRLERRDGVALGFTTHDRDLAIGGLVYRAAPGMLPSAISALGRVRRRYARRQGRADQRRDQRAPTSPPGAGTARAVRCSWSIGRRRTARRFAVARGELGEVSIKGDAFEAELRGPTALLDAPVVEQTSPECRAALGDKRCRVDMAGRTRLTRIAAVVADGRRRGRGGGAGRCLWRRPAALDRRRE